MAFWSAQWETAVIAAMPSWGRWVSRAARPVAMADSARASAVCGSRPSDSATLMRPRGVHTTGS